MFSLSKGYSDISPAECVGDVLVLHHDHEITKENGEIFLTDYPESISKDSSGFDQLIKCIGNDQRVEKDEQGQPQEIHVSRFMVPDLNHRVPISRQMRYALRKNFMPMPSIIGSILFSFFVQYIKGANLHYFPKKNY